MKITIKAADWLKDKQEIKAIRQQVFIEEQKVPEELEWDQLDVSALHFLASIDGQAVATGRLQKDAQLGRMAVLKPFRNKGIGSLLIKHMIKIHHSQLQAPLFLHAQTQATEFYKKFGFIKQGNEFMEAGIPHYMMSLKA